MTGDFIWGVVVGAATSAVMFVLAKVTGHWLRHRNEPVVEETDWNGR